LNIGHPLLIARAPFRRVVGRITTGERFQDICRKGAKIISALHESVHELLGSGVARNVVCSRLHAKWQF
jgi:hypothetical protein